MSDTAEAKYKYDKTLRSWAGRHRDGRGGELSAEGDGPRAWAELALLAGPRERRSRWALRVETGPREKKKSWAGLGC